MSSLTLQLLKVTERYLTLFYVQVVTDVLHGQCKLPHMRLGLYTAAHVQHICFGSKIPRFTTSQHNIIERGTRCAMHGREFICQRNQA